MKIKNIKGFPDYYITDTGEVYSRNYNGTGRIRKLKKYMHKQGYFWVVLCREKRRYHKFIHRLVAEAFIPNPENKPNVNHINGDTGDERVKNLEWVTQSENVIHGFKCLGRTHPRTGKFGKDCPISKVVLQSKNNVVVGRFFGTCEAQRETGINSSDINKCCAGKRKSAGGFCWAYEK